MISSNNKVIIYCIGFFLFSQTLSKAQDTLQRSAAEKEIDRYLTYFSGEKPGATILLIKDGKIIFNKAYGLANVETKEKNSTQKAFNLTGITKSITSVAVLKLVEKGKLSLEVSLSDIFQDFPEYGKKVKVKNLLSHTSGLKNYDPEDVMTNNQVLDFLKNQKETSFEPGSEWRYSNSDYPILVNIIEKVSKKSYKVYLNKYIFRKLKMSNTFLADDFGNQDIAIGHFKEGTEYFSKLALNQVYGEQGIFSTTEDFFKWEKAFFSNRVLDRKSIEKMFSVYELNSGKTNHFYGFGWVLMKKNGVRYYWHGGSNSGYTSILMHLPDTKATVLILSNRNDAYDFLKLAIQIAKEFDKGLKL